MAGELKPARLKERSKMKNIAASFAVMALLGCWTLASAANYSIELFSPVVVAGTELKPGSYTLELRDWQVFLRGKNTSVAALARVEQVEVPYDKTSIRYLTVEGKNLIQEIRIGHTNLKLVFPAGPVVTMNSGPKQ